MTLKHNLSTIMETLNRYVGIDKASGMIPITPMHMEINRMIEELEQLKQRYKEELEKPHQTDMWKEIFAQCIYHVDEVLG